ncbi:MFS transporter [Streptomyces sp. TLI_105]|uniref:MFS transporter n=1 Tax=Streptomyces sp. TLI_105 TaxID=1881019 RepID=UPI00089C10C8|nr:MFS transporter [Streptomyces sp. TLI_105]SED06930.1 hypothetical protein SAMN05428939_4110 [Streptomyces sp. TLI_105]
MSTSARSAATTFTGWGMVLSGAAAVVVAFWGVSPYPPLVPELLLAGLSALFAVGWVLASYRAAARDRDPLRKPRPDTRYPNPVLRYVLCFGVPLATFAAFLTAFNVSGSYGRETERLERAGYDEYSVAVVRLAGEPEFHEGGEDHDPYYLTDLALRIPYEAGRREVTLRGVYTRSKAPRPGTKVDVYFAPRDPNTPVTEDGRRSTVRLFLIAFLGIWIWPLLLGVGFSLKGMSDDDDVHDLRRFSPGVHLPALAVLLTGLLLLLPKALDFQVAGHDQLYALISCLTPALALTWVVIKKA